MKAQKDCNKGIISECQLSVDFLRRNKPSLDSAINKDIQIHIDNFQRMINKIESYRLALHKARYVNNEKLLLEKHKEDKKFERRLNMAKSKVIKAEQETLDAKRDNEILMCYINDNYWSEQ